MQISVMMYAIVGLIGVLSDIQTSQVAVVLQSCGFAVIAAVGLLFQVFSKKYCCYLIRKREDKSDIIKFAFTFGKLAQRHLANYQARRQEEQENNEVVRRIPAASLQSDS